MFWPALFPARCGIVLLRVHDPAIVAGVEEGRAMESATGVKPRAKAEELEG